MRGVQISYLIEHPEYIPQLAQWLFEQWDSILGEETPEARIKKLKTHMNRDKLPLAVSPLLDAEAISALSRRSKSFTRSSSGSTTAPANHLNRRANPKDYAVWEIHPVMRMEVVQ